MPRPTRNRGRNDPESAPGPAHPTLRAMSGTNADISIHHASPAPVAKSGSRNDASARRFGQYDAAIALQATGRGAFRRRAYPPTGRRRTACGGVGSRLKGATLGGQRQRHVTRFSPGQRQYLLHGGQIAASRCARTGAQERPQVCAILPRRYSDKINPSPVPPFLCLPLRLWRADLAYTPKRFVVSESQTWRRLILTLRRLVVY